MVYRYKKCRYVKVKTSSGETGTVVKNSRVIISRIKDGGFYLTEYRVEDVRGISHKNTLIIA